MAGTIIYLPSFFVRLALPLSSEPSIFVLAEIGSVALLSLYSVAHFKIMSSLVANSSSSCSLLISFDVS